MDSQKPSRNKAAACRLQKHLASCGLGSRRTCEEFIRAGRISVNGQPVSAQGQVVDPSVDRVEFDGRLVKPQSRLYIMLNKPRDVLCTSSDPGGRRICLDLVPEIPERVYTIGRLDRDSEGLIVLTNDGALAQRLTHPRYHVEKIYNVWSRHRLTREQIAKMHAGVSIDGERLRALRVDIKSVGERGMMYEVVLGEGRKRQIRRMFEVAGCRVSRLKRIAIGTLQLGKLGSGKWRYLRGKEVERLRGPDKP